MTPPDDPYHLPGRMVKDKDDRDLGAIDGRLVDPGAGKVRSMVRPSS